MALSMYMHEVWNTCSSVSKVDVSWLLAFKMNTVENFVVCQGLSLFQSKTQSRRSNASPWVSRPHHVYILHKDLMISSQVVHGVFETGI